MRPTRFRSSLVGRVEQVGRGVAGQKQAPDLPLPHLAARPAVQHHHELRPPELDVRGLRVEPQQVLADLVEDERLADVAPGGAGLARNRSYRSVLRSGLSRPRSGSAGSGVAGTTPQRQEWNAGMLRKLKVGKGWKQRYVFVERRETVLKWAKSADSDVKKDGLELRGAPIGRAGGAKAFAAVLKADTFVTFANLEEAGLGDEGAALVSDALRRHAPQVRRQRPRRPGPRRSDGRRGRD